VNETVDRDHVEVSGRLSAPDLKRLSQLERSGSIGPTTVYYAGLTAPVIVSSIALVTAASLRNAGMGGLGQHILAGFIAALAGICWYLIFIRWSDSRRFSRAIEEQGEVSLRASHEGLELRRGHTLVHIAWAGVREIRETRRYILLLADGAGDVLVPGKWFGTDTGARQAFTDYIRARIQA
jgi:hypothetical protein